jgi:lipopolysaccharide export system permease protein
MTIIQRYITSTIAKYFGMAMVVILGIFIAVDYLGTMDEFITAKISLWRAFFFVLLRIPFVGVQFIPVVLLLSILITFGLMSKNNEIVILQAGGISIYRLIRPVMTIALLCGLGHFYLAESVVPPTMAQANKILYQEIRKKTKVTAKKKNIWMKDSHQITHIAFFDPSKNAIHGFTRFFFDNQYRLIRRIDAETGEFIDGRWVLTGCIDQKLDLKTNSYDIQLSDNLQEALDLHPDDFKQIVKRSEEMGFRELSDYVRKVESEGYDATHYRVDLYAKSAYPFMSLVIGLIGVGFTARRKWLKGLPVAIALGIGIAFGYGVFHSFCVSLGYGGILPPLVAAWTANFVFFCASLLMLVNAE